MQTQINKEISHYEIKGFRNIKAGFIYFDTQSSLKNNTLTLLGRAIIKMTTGAGIEHIGYVSKVPPEFVSLQYEDRYNGKDIIEKGYVFFEATNHFDSIATNVVKRMERPSLNDINKKGDSKWTGDVYLQEIQPEFITDNSLSLAFQLGLDLTNKKPWINGYKTEYSLLRAELSPFPFAKTINRLIGYKKLTPSVFCSVQAKYLSDILTGQVQNPKDWDILEGLGTNPKDLSRKYISKQYSKIQEPLITFVDGKAVAINPQHVIANPIYK
jgi:hypothetical protein